MGKQQKQINLREGEDILQELVAFDFRVQQLSQYHFRINDRLDVWPSSKRWYDRQNYNKGQYGNLVTFVKAHFAEIIRVNKAIGLIA